MKINKNIRILSKKDHLAASTSAAIFQRAPKIPTEFAQIVELQTWDIILRHTSSISSVVANLHWTDVP